MTKDKDIVDSGISYNHPDLIGRAFFGFDAYGGQGEDCFGHGTGVASTLGMFFNYSFNNIINDIGYAFFIFV